MPGDRDLFAQLIRLYTPSNFEVFQLSLAGACVQFHGQLIRTVTAGQLPAVNVADTHTLTVLACPEEL